MVNDQVLARSSKKKIQRGRPKAVLCKNSWIPCKKQILKSASSAGFTVFRNVSKSMVDMLRSAEVMGCMRS